MGALLSFLRETEDVIEDISFSEKFIKYQEKFNNLFPSKKLYLDVEGLYIESLTNSSWSSSITEFDWMDLNVENRIYNYLNIVLDIEYKNSINSDVNMKDITKDIKTFINKSINTDLYCDNWLEKYFDNEGYDLFKTIGEIIDPKCKENYYSPQSIWVLMLGSVIYSNQLVVRKSETPKYNNPNNNPIYNNGPNHRPNHQPNHTYEIINKNNNNVIVIINRMYGSWRYVYITPDCLNTIFEQYDNQKN